jgi:hypothetical protein
LQTVWNECVRFGGHINIQVTFKILQLEVLKEALILYNPTCFQEVKQLWTQSGLRCLGDNNLECYCSFNSMNEGLQLSNIDVKKVP